MVFAEEMGVVRTMAPQKSTIGMWQTPVASNILVNLEKQLDDRMKADSIIQGLRIGHRKVES